jgi:hypothetical protein
VVTSPNHVTGANAGGPPPMLLRTRQRVVAGLLLAPLFTVLVNVVMAVPMYFIERSQPQPADTAVYPDPSHTFSYIRETAVIFSIYSVPAAFLTLLILWLPLYLFLRRHGWAKPLPVLLLCAALALPALFLLQAPSWGAVVTAFMFLHGIVVGFAFIWISGLGFSQPTLQPESRTNGLSQ